MIFNYYQFKIAQQRGQFPPSTLPITDRDRWINEHTDHYNTNKDPGDGQGQNLITPGSEGMLGVNPDPGFQAGGKERKGYPSGISQSEDPADSERFQDIPDPGSRPEDPMTGKSRAPGETEYGKGQGTDYGEALHDDRNVHNDGDEGGILGIEETTKRDMSGHDLDRKPEVSIMQGKPESPFNARMRRNGPMKLVRDRLRSAAQRRSQV